MSESSHLLVVNERHKVEAGRDGDEAEEQTPSSGRFLGFITNTVDSFFASRQSLEAANATPFRWKFALIAVMFAIINDATIWTLTGTVAPFIKKRWFHNNDKTTGEINSIVHGVTALCAVPVGLIAANISDRFGRRPMLLIVAFVSFVPPCLLYAFNPNPWPFMISAAIAALIARMGWSTMVALLSDVYTTEAHRTRAISMWVGGRMLGGIIAFCYLLPGADDKRMILSAIGTGALGIIYTITVIPETLPSVLARSGDAEAAVMLATLPPTPAYSTRQAFTDTVKDKLCLTVVFLEGMSDAAWFGVGDNMNYYLSGRIGWSSWDIAVMNPLSSAIKVVYLFLGFPLLQTKLSPIGIAFMSNMGELIYVITVLVAWKVWILIGIGTPFQAMTVLSGPCYRTMVAATSPPHAFTMRQTTVQALQDIISGGSQIGLGYIYKALPSWVLFAGAIALMVATVILNCFLFRWVRKPTS